MHNAVDLFDEAYNHALIEVKTKGWWGLYTFYFDLGDSYTTETFRWNELPDDIKKEINHDSIEPEQQ